MNKQQRNALIVSEWRELLAIIVEEIEAGNVSSMEEAMYWHGDLIKRVAVMQALCIDPTNELAVIVSESRIDYGLGIIDPVMDIVQDSKVWAGLEGLIALADTIHSKAQEGYREAAQVDNAGGSHVY